MSDRRTFIKTSLIGGISTLSIPGISAINYHKHQKSEKLGYRLTRDVPAKYYDGRNCWVHPRAGIVPGVGDKQAPRVVFTMTTQDNLGSDIFKEVFGFYTNDNGQSWTEPQEIKNLRPLFEVNDKEKIPIAASDLWPAYHKASKTLFIF